MINALKELQNTFKYNRLYFDDVICLHIIFNDLSNDTNELKFQLKTNYSKDDLELLNNNLNFEYENHFITQQLIGTIWLSENRWLIRKIDYNICSQWWKLYQCPKVPGELL